MIQFTYEDVLQSLKNIVHAKGEDYIYNNARRTCVYYEKNGEPSCLVGHFLYENELVMAVDAEEYEENDAQSVVWKLGNKGIAEIDERATYLLQNAQECQDWGHSWGDSLSTAIEAVTERFGV